MKFVLSDAQQKILKYNNPDKSLSNPYYEGQKLGEIWGYKTIGIAQSDEEMNQHLANAKQPMGQKWAAGDIMYADLDNSGSVDQGNYKVGDSGDWQIIGNNTPRFNYGITIDAAWKGLDFRAFVQGIGKRDYWLNGPYFWGFSGGGEWASAGFKEHLSLIHI